ncbi:MAG: carbonic anhydrase [Eubacteriales bacterium]|nr:carbonic anhydrase [Eubacteriales bacterium]
MIDKVLEYNKRFVENKEYEKYQAGKMPEKKLAILACMDTRLTELLPAALGLKDGDAKIIKNAGAVITHPFGSVVRSLLIAIVELGVENVMVIGHTDCGVQHIDSEIILEDLHKRGISTENVEMLKYAGVDFEKWLCGFNTVRESVENTVKLLKEHPLIPNDVGITGYVMDTKTGELYPIC